MTVRPARPEDVEQIHSLVRELAAYERAADEVASTPKQLSDALFAPTPQVFCHVAESESSAGTSDEVLAGFALWYVTYSTWTGRHGIWLEDLFVRPAHRSRGHGRDLLAQLAAESVSRGYGRLEWWVLDWNHPAREFYASLGAVSMDEWTVNRLDGAALDELARVGRSSREGRA